MNSGKSHREKPMGNNMTKLRKLRGSDILDQGEKRLTGSPGGMEYKKLLGNEIRQKLNEEEADVQK